MDGVGRKQEMIKKRKVLSKKKKVYLLEQHSSVDNIKKIKTQNLKFIEYHWEEYSFLAYKREQIFDEIKLSLSSAIINDYTFENWSRCVRFKFSHHPLCTVGSIVDNGGRFNIGKINRNIQPFHSLYIAENSKTSLQEHLGIHDQDKNDKLTGYDLALMRSNSHSDIKLSGKLEQILDITDITKLSDFLETINKFEIPEYLIKKAKNIGLDSSSIIQTLEQLEDAFYLENFRIDPVNFDIPSASQIFGQIAFRIGFQGILYNSTKTNHKCLAVFPENFHKSESYITIVDESPSVIKITKIDKTNYNSALVCYEEL